MSETKQELVEYYKKVVNGLWENQHVDICNAIQIKHNVECFKPLLEKFASNKDFCDFLNSIENEYKDEEKHHPTKATTFKIEYLKAFGSFQYGDSLLEASYEKLLRFMNYTIYKHNYLIVKAFTELNEHKLKTKVRTITTKGIVALNMKSKSKQRPIRDAIKVDKESGVSVYRFFPDHYEGAWEHSFYMKDSVVNTFIKNNAKKLQTKRTDKEVLNEYSFLRGYHFKYERGNDMERSAYKGKREAEAEKQKLVKRIGRSNNQLVINLLSKSSEWSMADQYIKNKVLSEINMHMLKLKKWSALRTGTADLKTQNEFIKKVDALISAFE
jgi:hypothetical protein